MNEPRWTEEQYGNYDEPCVHCEGRAFRLGECPRLRNGASCMTAGEVTFRRRQRKALDAIARRDARDLALKRGHSPSAREQLALDEREARR